MKKKRNLIIALGVLVVFSLFYVFLTLPNNEKPLENDNPESIDIINRNHISYIEVKPEDEKSFAIEIDKKSEANKNISVQGYEDFHNFDETLLFKLVGSLEGLKAYNTVQGIEEDYGINDDSAEVILNYKDNTSLTLRFGSETITPGKVYMQVKEQGEIYVVRKDIKDICNSSIYTFRIPQLLPTNFMVKEGSIFTNLEIKKVDGSRIIIRPQTKEEININKSDVPSIYIIEEPTFWECSDGKVYSQIISPMLSIGEEALVVEDFPVDLSIYGITKDGASIKLNVEDHNINITFGNETEDGYVYAMNNEIPSVVKVPKSSLTMMKLEWFDLINTSLIMRSIDKIMSFTLETNERNYEIQLLRNEEGGLKGGIVNGFSIEESTVRNIYMKLLNIHIEGKNPNGEPDLPLDYKVTINLLDGTNESIEFTQINGRNYSISKNGKGIGFYTGFSEIRDLLKVLDTLE